MMNWKKPEEVLPEKEIRVIAIKKRHKLNRRWEGFCDFDGEQWHFDDGDVASTERIWAWCYIDLPSWIE